MSTARKLSGAIGIAAGIGMLAFAIAGGASSAFGQTGTPTAATTGTAISGTTTSVVGTATTTPAAAGTSITAAGTATPSGASLPSTGTGPGGGSATGVWFAVGGILLALLGGSVIWSGARRRHGA